MKNKWISLAAAGILLLLAACNNEDDPVASEDLGIVDMFSPGADADQEVKDIYNKYGVWVRTHFDDIDELANAIIAEDQMVSMRGATNIQEQYIPETYAYTQTLLGNVSVDFVKQYFPLEFFYVETCGASFWTYDLLSIGRSRLVICWPNQMEGCIPVTDPVNHYYQDSVLTVNVWNRLVNMVTLRMNEDLLPEFGAAGKMYDGGEASDNIYQQYQQDGDEEKYNQSMQELADGGGFISGDGSSDFRSDIGEWLQLLVTESYDNIKRTYLDNNSMRAQKYEILVNWLKDNFDWDIQAAGNKFRAEYDAYKATLPPPDPDESGEDEEIE